MRYSENMPHNNYLKHVNNINSDGCGPPENKEKNFGPPPQEMKERSSNYRRDHYNQRGGMSSRGCGSSQSPFKPPYYMYHGNDTNQPSHQRLSNLPRIQKKNGARPQPASTTILIQGSQSHNVVVTISPTILPIIPFAILPTNSPK
jgi:hypothetical protein